MLVAFWDQVFGELDPALLERRVLRVADHGIADLPPDASNGLTPAAVKRLPTLTPSPAAVMLGRWRYGCLA